jgi:hypothetical protein
MSRIPLEDRIHTICQFVLEHARLQDVDEHIVFLLALHGLLETHFEEAIRQACRRQQRDVNPSCN